MDSEESWALKNWCFWTVVLEKSLESPLDCKEIQPVHSKEDQSWVFIGRTDAESETPIFGHLMWRVDSLEKTLMLGGIRCGRKRRWQRMRWLDGITNSCPLSWWCYPTISSSVIPFSSCLQSFPAPGSFPLSQFFASGGQIIGVSASASVPNGYSGMISFRMDWLALLSAQGTLTSLLQHHNWKVSSHQFFNFFRKSIMNVEYLNLTTVFTLFKQYNQYVVTEYFSWICF